MFWNLRRQDAVISFLVGAETKNHTNITEKREVFFTVAVYNMLTNFLLETVMGAGKAITKSYQPIDHLIPTPLAASTAQNQ